MIIVDHRLEDLEREGTPIQLAMVGAGFMGRGIALHFATMVRGMRLACVVARNVEKAAAMLMQAGFRSVRLVRTSHELEQAIREKIPAVTTDYWLATDCALIDAVLEVTGSVDCAAGVISRTIEMGKHVILMNSELDGTLGPLLYLKARGRGVVYNNAEGDQPGVILNLYRFVKGTGARPMLCGNIKVLHDPYSNPSTQHAFADQWGQNVYMVTSFADGTKIGFEQAVVASATGFRVVRRGMLGPQVPPGSPVTLAPQW